MMNDTLIDKLVNDLAPQKPLLNYKLWVHCTSCLFLVAVMIIGLMRIRDDYLIAIQAGSMFWKPGIFLLIWLASILLILDISRPTGSLKRHHALPLIASALIIIWQFVAQAHEHSLAQILAFLRDKSAFTCLPTIFIGGGFAFVMAWKFWLSKTASPRPVALGALAGLSAGSLAAAAYALHCEKDAALYISVYYMLPIFALCMIGAILGKKNLRW
ncbi:MAG: NrsF family protein [Holosporales bacterium]|jgi:hypothetical protein